MVEETRPRQPGEAWRDAWSQVAVMLADHIPLVIGVALVVTVHKIRSAIMPAEIRSWTRVIDGALLSAEFTLFASLVLTVALVFSAAVVWAQLPTAPPEQVGLSSARLGRLGTVFKTEIEQDKLPGAVRNP